MDGSVIDSSEAGTNLSTEADLVRTDHKEVDSLVEKSDSSHEPAKEMKTLSKTARRNQRTRQKVSMAKKVAREASAQNVLGSLTAANIVNITSATEPAGSSVSKPKVEGAEVGTSPPLLGTEVKMQSLPTNPTAAERLKLKSQFMDIFQQEYKLDEECRERNASKLMTSEELAEFNCKSSRPLVSVHGDIFDVSRNLNQYGPGGSRSFEAGSDITWAAVSGFHTEGNCNCFYDVFKAPDDHVLTSRCMSLCSTIAAFQRDYGKPVGRLSIYNEEERLPAMPMADHDDVCPVQ